MVGVLGKGGNEVDVGDDLGDGGDAPFTVELVDGRCSSPLGWKALNTRELVGELEALSPKDVESSPMYLAK